jgi:type I restriction enzyme S subunit
MAVDVQERIVAALRALKAVTMAKLFREGLRGEPLQQTEIGEIPESWNVVRVRELVTLGSGQSRPREMSPSREESKPFPVYGGNGVMGYSDQFLTATEAIVIGRVGAYCGSVYVCPPQSWVTDNALYHRDPVSQRASLHFLAELLAHLKLNRLHRQGAQPLITQGSIQALDIPLPKLPEQEAIASIARRLDERIAAAGEELGTLNAVFSSMLHMLMTGQVRAKGLLLRGARAAVGQAGSDRARELLEKIECFVSELVRRFEPERVILFGRPAEGSPGAGGKVGLLVVVDFEGRALAEAVRIEREIEHSFALEVMVRRPEEIRRALESGNPLIKRIVEEGNVLYARPDAEVSVAADVGLREQARRATPKGKLSDETLREIVRRVVEAVAPEKIILFGSAARGEMGPDSDVDLLVVKSGVDRLETARAVRRSLLGIGIPKDVIAVTPEDLSRHGGDRSGVIFSALREGKVVYAAA